MKNAVLLIPLLVFNGLLLAQQPISDKCSPTVVLRGQTDTMENFALVVADLAVFREWLSREGITLLNEYQPANIAVVRTTRLELAAKIMSRPDVLFADRSTNEAREELLVPGHNLFLNKINVAQSVFFHLNGAGMVISIKEFRFDTADADLKNRTTNAPNATPQTTVHAGIMATLAGGAGNSGPAGRGVAWGARLISNGFNTLLPEDDYAVQQITVQNHSYGVDVENYYGAGAMAYDRSVEQNPSLVHVFSSGNKGPETSSTGVYAGIPGFANLTGNFKMAKNVLTVGAVDSFGQVVPYSSRGPAYDGRLKPDLTAYGAGGTSESAALVSGAGAVLQQALREQTGVLQDAALVRAVLLNGADDIGAPGPDFISGYGNMNLKKSLETIVNQQYGSGEVLNGEMVSIPLEVPPGLAACRIMLTWDDPAALPNAPKSLVNDLDLKVIAPDGMEWLPWAPNPFPHRDSLLLPASRQRDTLNNAEQVVLDLPVAGQYMIQVAGSKMKAASQAFSVCWYLEKAGQFAWNFPVRNDPAVAAQDLLLSWENAFDDTTGTLEWHVASAPVWQMLDSSVQLRRGWMRWPAPDIFAVAQLRMHVGGQIFDSDSFLIAKELRVKIGFNCPDSTLLFWNAAVPGGVYLLSGLGEKYLEPLRILTDTIAVLQKADFPQTRFSVTPIGEGGVAGLRSTAPDIGQQGVECYFAEFFAELNAGYQTDLRLRIGTRYGIQVIEFEKMTNGVFSALAIVQPVESEVFEVTDDAPQQGANIYRARLELLNGAALYSDTATVYFWGKKELLVFPNPVYQNSIRVVSNTTETSSFILFDMLGRIILEAALDDFPKDIAIPIGLPKGCYPYCLRTGGQLKPGGILIFGEDK
ncbi:MAG: hypothetical protein EPGJADBJ_01827 [Saprospiraceae bacterium]|nr:hypothetical protein [Saprospiraceae bacterium]